MNELERIEQQFGFSYPALYKQLHADGMLSYGQTGPNWFADVYPTLVINPPLLLFGNDIELYTPDEIIRETAELRDPNDYRKVSPDLQLVPFAQTGGGDLYCFLFGEQKGDDVPIVLAEHDCEEATYMAKNLQDFIFGEMLLAVVDLEEEYSSVLGGDFKGNLFNMLRTHQPYLTQHRVDVLTGIYNRELFEYKYRVPAGNEYSATGLLSHDEFDALLKQETGFDKLDQRFVYMG